MKTVTKEQVEVAYRKCANSGSRELEDLVAELFPPEHTFQPGQVFAYLGRLPDGNERLSWWKTEMTIKDRYRPLNQKEVGPDWISRKLFKLMLPIIKREAEMYNDGNSDDASAEEIYLKLRDEGLI